MNFYAKSLLCVYISVFLLFNYPSVSLAVSANDDKVTNAEKNLQEAQSNYEVSKINLKTNAIKFETFMLDYRNPLAYVIGYPVYGVAKSVNYVVDKTIWASEYPFKYVINPNFRLKPVNTVLMEQKKKTIDELKSASKGLEGESKTYAENIIKDMQKETIDASKVNTNNISIPYAVEYANSIEDLYRSGISAQSKFSFGTTITPMLLGSIATAMSFTGTREAAAITGLTGSSILSINQLYNPKKRQQFYLEGLNLINQAKTATIVLSDTKDFDLVVTAKIVNDLKEKIEGMQVPVNEEIKKGLKEAVNQEILGVDDKIKNASELKVNLESLLNNLDNKDFSELQKNIDLILITYQNVKTTPKKLNKDFIQQLKKEKETDFIKDQVDIERLYQDLIINLGNVDITDLRTFKKTNLDKIDINTTQNSLKNTKQEFIELCWKIMAENKKNPIDNKFSEFQKNVDELADVLEKQAFQKDIETLSGEFDGLKGTVSTTIKEIDKAEVKENAVDKRKIYNDDLKKLKALFDLKSVDIQNNIDSSKKSLDRANDIYDDALSLERTKIIAGPMLVTSIEKINYKISKMLNEDMPDFSTVRAIVKELPRYTLEFSGYNKWAEEQLRGKRMNYSDYLDGNGNNNQLDDNVIPVNNTTSINLKVEVNAENLTVSKNNKFVDLFKGSDGNSILSTDLQEKLATIDTHIDKIQKGQLNIKEDEQEKPIFISTNYTELLEKQNKVVHYLRIYMGRLLDTEQKTVTGVVKIK